jgi:hypothetical protein
MNTKILKKVDLDVHISLGLTVLVLETLAANADW